ncbi:hypothetical protein Ga0100231_006420 [Opitutaceae bacterium TAV4]|nr:hypothetical protein Ga0100231_006420 [Opitutaceae bacterium TAV4]RRK02627.1 hypothetical protein Ga0100230_005830 [Opitutaceae bacterium TAV3]
MKTPLQRRILSVALVLALVGLIVIFVFRQSPQRSIPAPDQPASKTIPANTPSPVPSAATIAQQLRAAIPSRAFAATTVVPLSSSAYPPTVLLLNAAAGSFAGKAAADAVAAFASQTPEAVAELARLAASDNATERLLALHLRLEISGPDAAILASAASDPSPWVAAQAAEWLFFHARFDLWQNYLRDVQSAWTDAKTDETVARLALNSTGATGLPAGMVVLQLGRALPDFVGALLAESPDLRTSFQAVLFDTGSPSSARETLLDIFHQTQPPGYLAALETLIGNHAEDSPARFRAFVYYAAAAPVADGLARLETLLPATSGVTDHLAARFEVAQRLLSERAANDVAAPTFLADTRESLGLSLSKATSLRELSESERRMLNRYLIQLRTDFPSPTDTPLLERIATLLKAEPYQDYSARRLTAQTSYLANQSHR